MPLALGTVVKESLNSREWIDDKEFRSSVESVVRKPGWGLRVPGVGEVLGWGFRMIVGEGREGKENGLLEQGKASWKVVLISNLELAASEITGRMSRPEKRGRTEQIFSKKAFQEEFKDVLPAAQEGRGKLSDEDTDLLLKFLQRDKGVLVSDGITIRFLSPGENSTKGITLEDSTIASLKSLIHDLNSQTTLLTTKIDALTLSAKEAVAKKNRISALSLLRSKKLAETTLQKRHATLAQLEDVFNSIEQANDQVELMKVMQDSTTVLRGLNKEVGGVERVDEVVEELREQMGVVSEVGDVIAEVGGMNSVDESEVDGELEEMERVEREKREAVEAKARAEREAKEKVEREERETREAEETRRRLEELEEVEREAVARRKEKEAAAEKSLDDSTELLSKISLGQNAEPEGTVG